MIRELLDNILSYLNAYITLQQLETWLVSNLQKIIDSNDKDAAQVANEIDAHLVEFGEGLIDLETLHAYLESYIELHRSLSLSFNDTQNPAITKSTAAVSTINDKSEMGILSPVVTLHSRGQFG
jgi:hypothetical protein